FSSRRRHTRCYRDWSSDVCSSDLTLLNPPARANLTGFPAEADGQGNIVVHLFAGDGTFAERVQNGQLSFPISEFPILANVGGVRSEERRVGKECRSRRATYHRTIT